VTPTEAADVEIWATDDVFLRAFGVLLGEEGGFVDDPDDSGGRTIFGVSERSHPHAWEGGAPTLDDAARIAYQDYWRASGADRISSWDVRLEVFTSAYLMGPGTAVRFLQQAMNALEGAGTLRVDGRFGPKTRAAVNGYRDPVALTAALNVLQGERAFEIAQKNASQRRFLRSWIRRSIYHS
jgi:lysozyme family protein